VRAVRKSDCWLRRARSDAPYLPGWPRIAICLSLYLTSSTKANEGNEEVLLGFVSFAAFCSSRVFIVQSGRQLKPRLDTDGHGCLTRISRIFTNRDQPNPFAPIRANSCRSSSRCIRGLYLLGVISIAAFLSHRFAQALVQLTLEGAAGNHDPRSLLCLLPPNSAALPPGSPQPRRRRAFLRLSRWMTLTAPEGDRTAGCNSSRQCR